MPAPRQAAAAAPIKNAVVKLNTTLAAANKSIKAALPSNMSADRMQRIVLTYVQMFPELLEATQSSLIRALLQSAQLGLYPDPILGHAYLVPFKNQKKGGVKEIQLIVGYKGIIQLTYRSDQIRSVHAAVVYDNDEFVFEQGDNPRLRHVPNIAEAHGKPMAAYAIAHFKDRETAPMFIVLSPFDVAERRMKSKAKDNGPWVTDTMAMWRKTAVRALAPFLPLSPEDQRLINKDELAEDETVELDLEADDVIDLADGGTLDIASVAAAAESRGTLGALGDKYDPAKREPGDEAPTHPCCGELASGPHKTGCPNVG